MTLSSKTHEISRAVSPESEIPERMEEQGLRPHSLDIYVGQEHLKSHLKIAL